MTSLASNASAQFGSVLHSLGSALNRLSLARLASSQFGSFGSVLHRLGLVVHRVSAARLASSQAFSALYWLGLDISGLSIMCFAYMYI